MQRVLCVSCREDFDPAMSFIVSAVVMKKDVLKDEWKLPIGAGSITCDLIIIDPPRGKKDAWIQDRSETSNMNAWEPKDLVDAIQNATESKSMAAQYNVAVFCDAFTLGDTLKGLATAGLQSPKVSLHKTNTYYCV